MPKLLLFAAAREAADTNEITVPEGTLKTVLAGAIQQLGPDFERVLHRCSVVVNERSYDPTAATLDALVGADDTVAILPPVSGGDHDAAPGGARMIDVADKDETVRLARATCTIRMRPEVRELVTGGLLRKGDALAVASVAGILAAKRVPEAIPLCHPVRTTGVDVTFAPEGDDEIVVHALVRGLDRTGFEMEALAAASTAALTIYDMAKGDDPAMRIDGLRVIAKEGGASGDWSAE